MDNTPTPQLTSYHPRHFQDILDVLDGKRLPLNAATSKTLYFLLHDPKGCDVTISQEGFVATFPNMPDPNLFFFSMAAAVVSQLLTWAEVTEATKQVRVKIGPEEVDRSWVLDAEFPLWSFGARLLWLDATSEQITFSLRDGSYADRGALKRLPPPLPQPLCPYCGKMLRSTSAKQCRHCKRDWHNPENLKRLGR